jgi:hypothetical protein
MPLNVPVSLIGFPRATRYTVHTDRQRWSAERLAAEPEGCAALEEAVRAGVRTAAPACAYAALTEADVVLAEHPDGSVGIVGRVLCDEAQCYDAAQRHRFDVAEDVEAKTAARWATQKDAGLTPGQLQVTQHVWAERHVRHMRVLFRQGLVGVLLATVGGVMGQYDYRRPVLAPVSSVTVWLGENADALCNHLAFPLIVAGALVVLYASLRAATFK